MPLIPKSVLAQVIEDLPETWKMTASGVRNFLTKRGVKEEELKWSGVGDDLDTYDPNLVMPKADLADMLNSRQDVFKNTPSDGYEYTVLPETKDYAVNVREFKDKEPRYVQSHFNTSPNYLLHTRTGSRKIGGIDTHEIQEIQSDLHQQARQHGYTDPQGVRPESPLKDNWLVKGIEQELLTALEKDKQAIAIPLEGEATSSLVRGKGVQEWYKTSVRNTLKKIAKRIGGEYKEVTEGLEERTVLKQPADLYEEVFMDDALAKDLAYRLSIDIEGSSNAEIADEIVYWLNTNYIEDYYNAFPDSIVKKITETTGSDVTYGQIVLPKGKLKTTEVELPKPKSINTWVIELNEKDYEKVQDLYRADPKIYDNVSDFVNTNWIKVNEALGNPTSAKVPAHTVKTTVEWDKPPETGYELTKLRMEFPDEYDEILGEVNESLGKPYNATGKDAPEEPEILNYVQSKWGNIKQSLSLPVVKEEKDYTIGLPEWAKKLELYTAAGVTAGTAATSEDVSAKDVDSNVSTLLAAGVSPDEIRQTLPRATTEETRNRVEAVLAQDDGVTTNIPIEDTDMQPSITASDAEASTTKPLVIDIKYDATPAEDNPVITAIERGYSIDEIKSYLAESQNLSPEDAHSTVLNSFKGKVNEARSASSDEEIKVYLRSEYGLSKEDIETVMFKEPSIAEPVAEDKYAMPEIGAAPVAPPEQPATLKPKLLPVNTNPTPTGVDTSELSSMLRVIHDRDMSTIDYLRGVAGNEQAKSRSDSFDQQLSYTIANALRQMGKDVRVNSDNELIEFTENGEQVPVDESLFSAIANRSNEILGGTLGGISGMAAGARYGASISAPIARFGGWPGKLAAGVITGATSVAGSIGVGALASAVGRGLDVALNAFHAKQELDTQHYIDAMKDTGQFAIIAELGLKPLEWGFKATKALYRGSKAVLDGNTAGAYKALKENLHLDDAQIDEIIKSWEELSNTKAPGMSRETKAMHVLPQVQKGGEAIVGPAASVNPRLSSNISKAIDDRAKNLLETSNKLTADNIGVVLHDELDKYVKDVKSYYGGIKTLGTNQMKTSGFAFDYSATTVDPLIEDITSKIRNPAVAENFKAYVDRIRKLGAEPTEDGMVVNNLRSFSDLLDLRSTINEFMQNKKIRNVADFDMVKKVMDNIDAEIARGAKEMPDGKAWLKEWRKANTEYSKMKTLEKNVLYKALTAKGANPTKIVNDLSKRITAIDGTFMEVLGTLPEHVRKQAEGAVLENIIKRHTVGFEEGFHATNFVRLNEELKHVGFTTEGTRELKRAIGAMAEVFKNDVNLQQVTGKIVKPEFKSYLTTDPVIRAKYEFASSAFNYIKRLAPTAQGEALALIMKVSKVLENPVSSKAIAEVEKALPADKELSTAIRQLAIQYSKFGEKATYPKVEVFRSGVPGTAHKAIDGPLGKGIYWTTNKTNAVERSNKTGGKIFSEKLLPSRVATEEDVKLLLGVDTIDKTRFKTDKSIAGLLKSRGYDGLSIGEDIVIFKE